MIVQNYMICIIRAISWAESRHGHGAGATAARDPMQVGNPMDSAWKNIGINPETAFDKRPVRQGVLTGLSWKQIPADVNGIINPTPAPNPPVLTYTINPLFHPNDGHQNASFTKEMSYFWGIIWYFYSLQQVMPPGEVAAWRLGNCKPKLLIDGAEKYNGGGDTNYVNVIKDGLKKSCCNEKFNL